VNQKFTILWLEDTDKVVTAQEKKLESFLLEKGFEMELIWKKEGSNLDGDLNEKGIDLILADSNIPKLSGKKLIEKLRETLPLTDILFYSALEIPDRTYNDVGRLGLVYFQEKTKNIVEPAKELIEKNIQLFNNIYFLRGYIIARSIELELEMNALLSLYFKIPKDKCSNFNTYMLENKYGNVIAKKVCIDKILEEKGIKSEFKGLGNSLQEIFEQRNIMAHCKVSDENTLECMGIKKSIKRDDLKNLLKKMTKASEMINKLNKKL